MMNSVGQIAGCVFGCIGGLFSLLSTSLPEWKYNESTDLDAILRYEGIWMKCVTYPSGQWQCELYDAFFIDLPKSLQIGRAFACLSVGFAFIAFLTSLVGMKCTTCLSSNESMKSNVALASGFLWISAGVFIGVAVSYYAYLVLCEYNNSLNEDVAEFGLQYIYGASLYLGWTSLGLCTISGGVMIGASRRKNNQYPFAFSSKKTVTNCIPKPLLKIEYV